MRSTWHSSFEMSLDVKVINMPACSASADRPGSGKSAPYHHGDLRRALTDAALDLIGERGPEGFALTEVARRAGVSAAAPYRHFADKSDLVAVVAELGFQRLHDALLAAQGAGTAATTSSSWAAPTCAGHSITLTSTS
jgi:AcrR family transcriptional regulator